MTYTVSGGMLNPTHSLTHFKVVLYGLFYMVQNDSCCGFGFIGNPSAVFIMNTYKMHEL